MSHIIAIGAIGGIDVIGAIGAIDVINVTDVIVVIDAIVGAKQLPISSAPASITSDVWWMVVGSIDGGNCFAPTTSPTRPAPFGVIATTSPTRPAPFGVIATHRPRGRRHLAASYRIERRGEARGAPPQHNRNEKCYNAPAHPPKPQLWQPMSMNPTCPFCGANVGPRSVFCPACGRKLPPRPEPAAPTTGGAATPPAGENDMPIEAALHSSKRIRIADEALNIRDLINVVESGVRWWQERLTSADITTRQHAAESIEELSRVLHSLSKQLAQGRETVRITTRLPALRSYDVGCPVCGRGNRAGAKYCLSCGAPLAGQAQAETLTVTPMALRFKIAARTDQGRVRHNNQDSIFTGTIKQRGGASARLALVADGMGGAKAGEQASRIAADVAQAQLQHDVDGSSPADDAAWQDLLRKAAKAANSRVYEESRADADRKGMGTTLTIALIVRDRLHVASVGDSRAYLLNAQGVTDDGATTAQLTSDHSLVARLVDIGQITPEQARTHPQRNLLYRSIGTDPSVEVDTLSEQLEPGDVVLLCSDGLFNHVRDEEIARIALDQPNPDRACEQLVALANERGGRDNISVVIVRVEGQK